MKVCDMKDTPPGDLIERLLERKYPNWGQICNSVVARRRESVYVSRSDGVQSIQRGITRTGIANPREVGVEVGLK